jgi:oligopeptide/dipeptide ABC transporter ATP-binding protein
MTIDIAVDDTKKETDPDLLLVVDNLSVSFPTDDGVVQAVRGVSYTVRSGESMGIVGESGSGKSVSSMAVMGLLPKNARITGSVKFRGRELIGLNEKEYAQLRGDRIAMIFQDPLTSLNPVYSIGFQIAEAVLAHNDVSKQAALERAVELLGIVGIPFPEQRINNYPHELSGGMRQRVVIAIGMANNPDVIIADEPTTALDVTVQAQVLEALEAARAETGAALILITHDLGVIAGHAERISVMYAGKLVETGTTEDVFYRPRMPYTLGLLGSLPRLDESEHERLTPIKGSPPSLLNLPPGCPFTPRCPIAQAVCDQEEPELLPAGGPNHAAACHFRNDVAGATASSMFGTESDDAAVPALAPSEVPAS